MEVERRFPRRGDDLGEHADLADRKPERVRQMREALTDWSKDVSAP